MDFKLCAWKKTLDDRLEKEPDLEKKIIENRLTDGLLQCYLCDGYNVNCEGYEALIYNKKSNGGVE